MESTAWPRKKRELQNYLMDSTRWNDFRFRDDDIIVATWSKSGTTWTQQILSQLVFNGAADVYGQALSPWIDFQLMPNAVEIAEAQTHRRFLKTHLPLDALVFSPRAKYLYVGRDARDVVWSLHNHFRAFTPFARDRFADTGRRTGTVLPTPADDAREFYLRWLEGRDFRDPSFWRHVQGWWDVRGLPNVMLLHYARMKADLPGEMRRIAKFLDVQIDESRFSLMLKHCSVEHMKERAAEVEFLERMFEGGGRTFVNRGTNGRWRDVLSVDEIARCDELAAQNLTPDCARWLETGEMPTS